MNLHVGDRVRHTSANSNGLGRIIGLNSSPPTLPAGFSPQQLRVSRLGEDVQEAHEVHQLNQMAVAVSLGNLYSSDRYPFVVRFDSGFEEVYGESELELVP